MSHHLVEGTQISGHTYVSTWEFMLLLESKPPMVIQLQGRCVYSYQFTFSNKIGFTRVTVAQVGLDCLYVTAECLRTCMDKLRASGRVCVEETTRKELLPLLLSCYYQFSAAFANPYNPSVLNTALQMGEMHLWGSVGEKKPEWSVITFYKWFLMMWKGFYRNWEDFWTEQVQVKTILENIAVCI